ncbi:MAG: RluA family pseudouridine synthase [Clostridia bacterium]|nr:RluA family pseudouridine synthase [Clostridia bacterium]
MPRAAHEIGKDEEGRTVKSIVLKEMRLSRGLYSSLKFRSGILLDGAPAHADQRVKPGQILEAVWEEESGYRVLDESPIPLFVPFEDDHYLIVDKPAPLPTLSSPKQAGPTLESALYAHWGCPRNYIFRPVNRLDKGTSGLMAVAKNAHAQHLLQRQLHTASFVREYLAICEGRLPDRYGVIDRPIGKLNEIERGVMENGVRAVTHYQVEMEKNDLSLVRLRLETGRTHQIRVHMKHMGCPIVGDYLYGKADGRLNGRFALHACRIAFSHPLTGEAICLQSELPPELKEIWDFAK